MKWARLALVSLSIAAASGAGCGSEDAPSDAGARPLDASDADAAAEGGAPAAVFGYFNVKITPMKPATLLRSAMPEQTSVIGAFGASATPAPYPWAVMAEEGECRLLVPRHPHCDPGCGSGAVCVADEEGDTACIAQPVAVGVGTLRISGLGAAFELERVASSYQPVGVTLDYPPCDEGEPIVIAADGEGAFAPFELEGSCVAPMDFPGPVEVEPGMPLSLRWTAAADPEATRVQVHFDISHHGGARGLIECEAADTGALEIAASLVQGLIDLGVSGFPTLVLTRSAVAHGSTPEAEGVVLTVSSSFDNLVAIPGLTSCTRDEHCEGDATCQPDFRCQ